MQYLREERLLFLFFFQTVRKLYMMKSREQFFNVFQDFCSAEKAMYDFKFSVRLLLLLLLFLILQELLKF